MPINKHKCCSDVKQLIYSHNCSSNRSHNVNGDFIHSSLNPTMKYKICRSLYRFIEREKEKVNNIETNGLKENKSPPSLGNENSNVKRQRRSFEDILQVEFGRCGYKKSFRDMSHPNRMRRVVPLAYNILASVIDKDEYNDKGRSYLFENAEEISIDIGFMLTSITRIVSKWMNYNIKIDFDKSTPPSPEIKEEHSSEINEKIEVI